MLLMILPAYALSRYPLPLDGRVLPAYFALISLTGFLIHRSDKRRAQAGEWRIPESTLHLVELLGGWPGAFLAMRRYRHKISKGSYQIIFWFVVLFYQGVAVDALVGFRYSRQAIQFISGTPR